MQYTRTLNLGSPYTIRYSKVLFFILINVLLLQTVSAQYAIEDIIIETGPSLTSIVSHYSDGCELYVIAKDNNQQNHLIHLSSSEEVISSKPISVQPVDFYFKGGKIIYVQEFQIKKYNIEDGTGESLDIPFSFGDSTILNKILYAHDKLYISYIKYNINTPIEIGFISIDANSLEFEEDKAFNIDVFISENLILNEFRKLGSDRILFEYSGDGLIEYQKRRRSHLLDENLNEIDFISSGETGSVVFSPPEVHNSANFTYENSKVSYHVKYTPDDGQIYELKSDHCNSQLTFMGVAEHEFGDQYAYQLDNAYFLMHAQDTFKVYNCFYQELSTYSDFPNVSQDDCSLYFLSLDNGNIKKRKLSSPQYCNDDVFISSQADIDAYNGCKLLNGSILINDGLDSSIDIVDLSGLQELIYVTGSIKIENCPMLTTLEGLSDFIEIKDSLVISGNELLDKCTLQFVCIETATGVTRIENNKTGCNTEEEINVNCNETLCPTEPVIIDNCTAASQFKSEYPFCTELQSDLIIGGNDANEPPSLTFEQLDFIKSTSGSVEIRSYNHVDDAILNIEYIGGDLKSNQGFVDLALPELTKIGGGIYFYEVYGDTLSVPQLRTVGSDFIFNTYVGDLNITSLDSIYGEVSLFETRINNIDFLIGSNYIGGDILISRNTFISDCAYNVICSAIEQDNKNIIIEDNIGSCTDLETVTMYCVENEDEDGDGYGALSDCNDQDPLINPGASEIINNDVDENCDGLVEIDMDLDGYLVEEDCDDQDPLVNPGASEVINNDVDEDCDGLIEIDMDLDGYSENEDCDDQDPLINPGASEVINNDVDENCDGLVEIDMDLDGYLVEEDCDDTNSGINPGVEEIYTNDIDDNCDGLIQIDMDLDGYLVEEDCDDQDSSVNPGVVEVQNNDIDENCDGILEYDFDLDGYLAEEDCNDQNPFINSGVEEIFNNDIDENCDGILEYDFDLDGYGDLTDCDDTNPNVNPGMHEVLFNGIDDDCNILTSDTVATCYVSNKTIVTKGAFTKFVNEYKGCNVIVTGNFRIGGVNISESLDMIYEVQGRAEFFNLSEEELVLENLIFVNELYLSGNSNLEKLNFINDLTIQSKLTIQNCPKLSECSVGPICQFLSQAGEAIITNNKEGCGSSSEVIGSCIDEDMDGYPSQEDCDDQNPNVNPGSEEIFNNGIDDDCDGIIELDQDNDGYGSLTDCDDLDPQINPGASEVVNNDIDENCDGSAEIDFDLDGYDDTVDCNDQDAQINPEAEEIVNNAIDENCDGLVEIDMDLDGYLVEEDCNDQDAQINPGASEIVNNDIDENCDGLVEIDLDLDGYDQSVDCEDLDPQINPGMEEILFNGVDDDCNIFTSDTIETCQIYYDVSLKTQAEIDAFALQFADCNVVINGSLRIFTPAGLNVSLDINPLYMIIAVKERIEIERFQGKEIIFKNLIFTDEFRMANSNGVEKLSFNNSLKIESELRITSCNTLSNCSVLPICNFLSQGGDYIFNLNAEGCNSSAEILENCVDEDMDGYLVLVDCNDQDSLVNPGIIEVPYDGIDNDCNVSTLDDDLDQDGFVLADDCNDNDPGINPIAQEVPNNGIDEDCDGLDLITKVDDLETSGIRIYPNPTTGLLYIDNPSQAAVEVILYNAVGELTLKRKIPHGLSDISMYGLTSGVYLMQLKGLGFLEQNKIVMQ